MPLYYRDEMFDDRAWYLIARSVASEDAGKLLGFSHFRFDMDYDDEVLYVYEIQLEDSVKRKGLGKFMMQVCNELLKMYFVFTTTFYSDHESYMFLKLYETFFKGLGNNGIQSRYEKNNVDLFQAQPCCTKVF